MKNNVLLSTPRAFELSLNYHFNGSSKSLVKATLKYNHLLGQGTRASVYAIPNLPTFVLLIQHSVQIHGAISIDNFIPSLDPLPQYNIGQLVASTNNGNIMILKRQSGTTYPLPYNQLFQHYCIDNVLGKGATIYHTDIAQYQDDYRKHLKLIANMPQKAYLQLAKKVQLIKAADLYIDPCALNILVDTDAQTFNTIDHGENIGPYENVLGLAFALVDSMHVYLDEHAAERVSSVSLAYSPELMALRQKILKKLFIAAIQTGLTLPKTACPKTTFGFHQPSFCMDYVLQISGFTENWENTRHSLLQIPIAA